MQEDVFSGSIQMEDILQNAVVGREKGKVKPLRDVSRGTKGVQVMPFFRNCIPTFFFYHQFKVNLGPNHCFLTEVL